MGEIRIFVESLRSGYAVCLRQGFEFLGDAGKITPGTRVTIKPNLTFPHFKKGVMTSPEALEATIVYLKDFSDRIVVCESDSGGYNPFSMDEVFGRTGIADMAKRYGVRVVNMSQEPSREIHFTRGLKSVAVPLPTLLLDDTDVFITMPVPKVHANAGISVALKNQWGVIQQPSLRLDLHPFFKEVIYYVTKSLPSRSLAIVDGKYGLTRNGPMRGDVVDLDWFVMGNSLFHVDFLMTALMGIDRAQVGYLKWIFQKERIDSLDQVRFNADFNRFKSNEFYLRREWTDVPGLLTFNSRFLAYLGYKSSLAKPLHWLLYRFREPFY